MVEREKLCKDKVMPRRIGTEWTTGFNHLRRYVKTVGDSSVPFDYVIKDGFKLGDWVRSQKTMYRAGELSWQAARLLNNLPGWTWTWTWAVNKKRKVDLPDIVSKSLHTKNWRRSFRKLLTYVRQKGYYSPPANYITKDGFHLGLWASNQRVLFKKGHLASERKVLLETIPGWQWKLKSASAKKQWLAKLSHLKTYIRQYGKLPKKADVKNGFKVGSWVTTQRYLFNCGRLDEWKRNLLEQFPGWKWPARRNRRGRRKKTKKRSSKE
jgi:hypothetical protein